MTDGPVTIDLARRHGPFPGVLDRARQILGIEVRADLGEVYDRLDANAPRIAIIGGSPDHPAHVMDLETVLRAATAVWLLWEGHGLTAIVGTFLLYRALAAAAAAAYAGVAWRLVQEGCQ